MRCPKCSYISFDKVTSCVKCSADVTEIAHALNGTAFKPLGTFYLGTLIPDYAAAFGLDQVAEDFAFDSGADDLDISMDAIDDFGDVPDLPGDISDEDFSLSGDDMSEFDGDELSLGDHVVPEMDLSGFGDEDAGHHQGDVVDDVDFDDVPDFDLSGMDIGEEADLDMAAGDQDASATTSNLSEIDLSLGEDELEMADEDEEMADLGDLEMEAGKGKDNGSAELPDLEL